MKCPYCECETTKVIDKRDNREDATTRRRRQCLRCAKRFTTYERLESFDISVVKKDGSLEKFDAQKIIKGIKKAVNENIITDDEIQDFAEDVERLVLNSSEPISTKEVGLKTLEWLKTKDPLSYIRFASVYKEFKDIEDIKEEISSLEIN